MITFEKLAIRQLDKQLNVFRDLPMPPRKGWIQTIRQTLKMSTYNLSKRVNIAQPNIIYYEKAEIEKRITLQKLEEMAKAMGCRVVYALVPQTSLEDFVVKEQTKAAQKNVQHIQETMALENQSLSTRQMIEQVELFQKDFDQKSLKKLWNEYEV